MENCTSRSRGDVPPVERARERTVQFRPDVPSAMVGTPSTSYAILDENRPPARIEARAHRAQRAPEPERAAGARRSPVLAAWYGG
jgi:hypothetical protein